MTLSTLDQNMLFTGWITTNQELRNATNQSQSYISFILSAVDITVLLTGWPCQEWVLMSYWQGDPVWSGCCCLIDRVTLLAVGFHVIGCLVYGDDRLFWIALISIDWGAVLNFGSLACTNECSVTERERNCDQMGDAQPSAITFYLRQQRSCCRVH